MNFWSFMAQNRSEIAQLTLEHLWIVGISTLLAVAVRRRHGAHESLLKKTRQPKTEKLKASI